MKFGPEVDDALGGRLSGVTYQLPEHCAAILRALLLNRVPARLCIGAYQGNTGGNDFELKFHTAPAHDLNAFLDRHRQDGFVEERDLSRKLSNKSIATYLLRRGPNAAVALIQKTNSQSFRKRVFQTITVLPRLLPGLFAAKGISEQERALLLAASEVDCAKIEALLEQIYKESDLSSERQKRALHGILSYSLSIELRNAQDAVAYAERAAETHLRGYMEQTRIATEKTILADGLECRVNAMTQDVENFMTYLSLNKAVSVNVEGNTLFVDVAAPLQNFDPDTYSLIHSKPTARFLDNIAGSREDALLFFDALFLEEAIKVNIGARYTIDPLGGVNGVGRSAPLGTVPNPHIYYNRCLGQYRGDMQTALSKSDYAGVISICIASATSLYIAEPPAFGAFVRDVTQSTQKAVLLPNGETVTYKEAVVWLKQLKGIKEGGDVNGETDQTNENGN